MRSLKAVLLFSMPVLLSGAAHAQSCSDVDYRTMKVLEKVFSLPASEISPNAEFVGRLKINDEKEDQLVSALENEFGIKTSQWDEDAEWNKVQDAIVEVRRITKCSG